MDPVYSESGASCQVGFYSQVNSRHHWKKGFQEESTLGRKVFWLMIAVCHVPRQWRAQVCDTSLPSWVKLWAFKATHWVCVSTLLPAMWTLVGFTSWWNGSCSLTLPLSPTKEDVVKLILQETLNKGKELQLGHRYNTSSSLTSSCLWTLLPCFYLHGKWCFAWSLQVSVNTLHCYWDHITL